VARYDEAFAHFRQAHDLARRYGSKYDAGRLARRIERIISIFDAPFVDSRALRKSPSERTSPGKMPVFIFGMPRSGTSLAEQILASHPSVFGAGEVVFWDAVSRVNQVGRCASNRMAKDHAASGSCR
jgi:hypothetical protein